MTAALGFAASTALSSQSALSLLRAAAVSSQPAWLHLDAAFLPSPSPAACGPLPRYRLIHSTRAASHPESVGRLDQRGTLRNDEQLLPLAPGSSFRLTAGSSQVRVEHVAGWSDYATLQGRPAGHGGRWTVTRGDTEGAADNFGTGEGAGGGAANAAIGMGGPNQRRGDGGEGGGSGGADAAPRRSGGGVSPPAYEVRPGYTRREAQQPAAAAAAAAGTTAAAGLGAAAEPGVPNNSSGGGGSAGGGGGAPTAASSGGDAGLLRLAVPEKWISLDISTEGQPVSVTRLAEAALRAATAGGGIALGTVRGTIVDLNTAATATAAAAIPSPEAGGAAAAAPPRNGGGGICGAAGERERCEGEAGFITGGEVSGTTVSLAASGPVRLRRLVGGSIQLTTTAAITAPTTAEAPAREAVAAAAASTSPITPPTVDLGAVYGGSISIRTTGGGGVRIGTLDCGSFSAPGQPAKAVAVAPSQSQGQRLQSHQRLQLQEGAHHHRPEGLDAGAQVDADPAPREACGGGTDDEIPSYFGAEIRSYGGSVVLDGLEGSAVVDSGGGAIRVLLQPGLVRCLLASGGGPVDVALGGGAGLALVEVRGAAPGGLTVEPDLQRHLQLLHGDEDAGAAGRRGAAAASPAAPAAGSGPACAAPHLGAGGGGGTGVWRARVAAERAERGGRGGGGRGPSHTTADLSAPDTVGAGGGFGGGVVTVEAGGGAVRLRRLGWMEALRAKMAERGARPGAPA